MSQSPLFKITYWGVTGTFTDPLLPTEVTKKLVEAIRVLVEKDCLQHLRPGSELEGQIHGILEQELPFHMRSTYGGNTTCVELETEDALFIFDCGSGFRDLGIALEERWKIQGEAARRHAYILLTHSHMDHTFATPFFAPYYNSENSFTVLGPKVSLDSLTAVLNPKSALSQIYFPPTYDEMTAIDDFSPLEAGADLTLGSTRIRTYALNHPGGSNAYRIEHGGRVFVFATDHEQKSVPDAGLADFARDCDLLYTEGQYTQAEYDGKDGLATDKPFPRHNWGHSPIEACVATALAANVRNLHVGHRDPRRDDAKIAQLNTYLQGLVRDRLQNAGRDTDSCQALIPHEGQEFYL